MFSFFIIFIQIGMGIISDILLFIPSIFLVVFFRRIRQRHSSSHILPIFQVFSRLRAMQVSTTHQVERRKKKSMISFPWWCLFIAYGLSFLIIMVSILLIIARGIEFGDVKVQKWLGSLVISFFSMILLSQPIKVCVISFWNFQPIYYLYLNR